MKQENPLRQNLLTGHWVIYAPARAKRPEDLARCASGQKKLTKMDPRCPFCPGNEKMLPEIIEETGQERGGLWLTRVVPNKYPVLTPRTEVKSGRVSIYSTMTASGRREVVIDNPYHNMSLAAMPVKGLAQVLGTYLRRYRHLSGNYPDINNIIVFRNHGRASGTSLAHPHSQIIATTVIPKYIRDRESTAKEYFRKNGRCPLCDSIREEKRVKERLVFENRDFLCFVPFASEVPFEVWIAPKAHGGDFGATPEEEMPALAEALKNVLAAYNGRLRNVDYNYIFHSRLERGRTKPYLHWYLQLRPRVSIPAGFEIGSGMLINSSLPEKDARILRGARGKTQGD